MFETMPPEPMFHTCTCPKLVSEGVQAALAEGPPPSLVSEPLTRTAKQIEGGLMLAVSAGGSRSALALNCRQVACMPVLQEWRSAASRQWQPGWCSAAATLPPDAAIPSGAQAEQQPLEGVRTCCRMSKPAADHRHSVETMLWAVTWAACLHW